MINTDMREYHIPVTVSYKDGYGQTITDVSWDDPAGTVMMAVYPTDYETQSNYGWNLATFVGLAKNITYGPFWWQGEQKYADLAPNIIFKGPSPLNNGNDSYFKVVQILKLGRYYQIFLSETPEP
jgi:hypothetical protein